eukprot:jgi/Hompol1/358/HPOL_001091-RA
MNSNVPNVYKWVMDDVIQKMTQRFAELGMDVNVLSELQQTWEAKIVNMGVAPFAPIATQTSAPYGYGYPSDIPGIQLTQQSFVAFKEHDPGLYDFTTGNFGVLQHQHPSGSNGHPFHLPQHDGPVDDDTEGVSASESATGDVPPQPSSDTHLTREKIDAMLLAVDPAALHEYAEVSNLLLCQFEKVQRVKNKWKCALKDGVINVNGKDYLFSKANCDFEW